MAKTTRKTTREKRSAAKPQARESTAEAVHPAAADVADKAPPDTYGVDQDRPVTQTALTFATQKLRSKPEFWGRYFKGPGNRHPAQYQCDKEANVFNRMGVKVLPIARQTKHVDQPDEKLGRADGLRNAAALMASFGAVHLSKMDGVAIFLDVEPENPMAEEYYTGWSAGLVDAGTRDMIDFTSEINVRQVSPNARINFVPCVYGHHRDQKTWKALSQAVGKGAVCEAAWVIYIDDPKITRKPPFPIGPWIDREFTSQFMPGGLRVALCQRLHDVLDLNQTKYDFNLVNPQHKDWLLDRLVLPATVSILP